MTFRTITGILGAAVADSATVVVNYPAGYTKGDFLGGVQNSMLVGQNSYNSPTKITVALGATGATITNKTGVSWPLNAPYTLTLDQPGSESGQLATDGRTRMPRVQPWPQRYLNLGSPAALNASGIRAAAAVAGAGPLSGLLLGQLDVPRNVTIQCAGSDAARVFTVLGKDAYGFTVTENIAGSATSTTAGKKAFGSITSISADAATAGNVNVGWGNVLGLPAYVPSAVNVIKELQDNATAAAGTLVVGDQNIPTATTGDVRGTYVPAAAPDGNKAYGLLVNLADPGYLGADQFAG